MSGVGARAGWAVRSARLTLAVVAAALLVAACGGSGGSPGAGKVDAVVYAGAMCKALTPFERDIYRLRDALDPPQAEAAAEHKAALQQFVTTVGADVREVKSKLKAAGTPDIAGGATFATALVALFGKLESELHAASAQIDALPTDSGPAYAQAVTPIVTQLRTAIGNLGDGLDRVTNSALEAAARKAPACVAID